MGYLVGQVAFDAATGMPIEASDSTTAFSEIIRNTDDSGCPSSCLRPAGMAVDNHGRLFFTSDATGEIYVLVKSSSTTGTSSSTGTGTMVTPTNKSAAEELGTNCLGLVVSAIAALFLVL